MNRSLFSNFVDGIRTGVAKFLFPEGLMPPRSKLSEDEEARRRQVAVLARKYYAGSQSVKVMPAQGEWLNRHSDVLEPSFNFCSTVVDAVVERLAVTGIHVANDETAEELAWSWWKKAQLDAMQKDIYRAGLIDGRCYIQVDWQEGDEGEDARPIFILLPMYTEETETGVVMEFDEGNYYLEPLSATKYWTEMIGGEIVKRKTIYYPERIEKYIYVDRTWVPYIASAGVDEDGNEVKEPFPLPWVHADGSPIGIPITLFRTPTVTSDIQPVIPIQDAINKVFIDVLAGSDASAFRTIFTMGFRPTTDGKDPKDDGSNLVRLAPSTMISTLKVPGEVGIEVVDPADLSSVLAVINELLYSLSAISDIPISRFMRGKQIAGAETLQEEEVPLLAKIEERQVLFGNAFEAVFGNAFSQMEAFQGSQTEELGELNIEWKDAQIRNEKEELEKAQMLKSLGVPTEFLFKKLGFSPEEIEEIMESEEYQTKKSLSELALTNLKNANQSNPNPFVAGKPGFSNTADTKPNQAGNKQAEGKASRETSRT